MNGPTWDDPYWIEDGDNVWARRLRRHQGWWRERVLEQPAGHIARRERPVVSMFPEDAGLELNLWTSEARRSLEHALRELRGRPGIIDDKKVRRNLLSSQPLCFNLFGYLREHKEALLPWVQGLAPSAISIKRIELEWSTPETATGGSAFDAFVEYSLASGRLGFLGVECKYAEDLTKSQRKPARDAYKLETVPSEWKGDAIRELDKNGLRQFWYNTLLAVRILKAHEYVEARTVVVACRDDVKAIDATSSVAQQLEDPDFLTFSAIEDVVGAVTGHEEWKSTFRRRYLDFAASEGQPKV